MLLTTEPTPKRDCKRQTRRSANTNIIVAIGSRTKTKKVKVVKEDSPFQTRRIVVVSHGKATQQ
jgi:hypothetical protein